MNLGIKGKMLTSALLMSLAGASGMAIAQVSADWAKIVEQAKKESG